MIRLRMHPWRYFDSFPHFFSFLSIPAAIGLIIHTSSHINGLQNKFESGLVKEFWTLNLMLISRIWQFSWLLILAKRCGPWTWLFQGFDSFLGPPPPFNIANKTTKRELLVLAITKISSFIYCAHKIYFRMASCEIHNHGKYADIQYKLQGVKLHIMCTVDLKDAQV